MGHEYKMSLNLQVNLQYRAQDGSNPQELNQSLVFPDLIFGCTNEEACNYDEDAEEDDGNCVLPVQYYDCNGDCNNDSDDDGVCDELEVPGCTDSGADNYNSAATDDDGSCEFAFCPTNEVTFVTVTLEDGNSLGWNLSDGTDAAGGNIEAGFYASNTTHTYTACLADDCYEVTMWDMNADGWNGGWIEVWMDGELMTTATMEDGFMESMNLGINTDCEEIGTGGSPFEFPDPIGFAPYPNPTEIETNLNGQGWDEHLPIEIEVRDVTGRLVSKYAFVPNASASNWILNTSSFEAGMYNIIGMQGRQSAHTSIMVR